MSESDTPRSKQWLRGYDDNETTLDAYQVMQELERELADMTKQRDEAKRKRNEIFQALNKERQWMHEKMEAIRETMKEFNQWLK
jgi:F0F1-type ATP synthase membrane subunit b/b'